MNPITPILLLALLASLLAPATLLAQITKGGATTQAGQLLGSLNEAQRNIIQKDWDDPSRTKWHYIPMDERKGIQLRDMNKAQQAATLKLLKTIAGEHGNALARATMDREGLLHFLEKKDHRDPLKYYLTIFGQPGGTPGKKWGISFEGHHLSLNYTLIGDRPISATPMFLGINPDIVKKTGPDLPPIGDQILTTEAATALALATSLGNAKVVEAPKAERDMKEAGHPTIKDRRRGGVRYDTMTDEQQHHMLKLLLTYTDWLPHTVREDLLHTLDFASLAFAWSGPIQADKEHSYRIANETLTILYYNTLADSLGNKPNHSHAIIRVNGQDFGARVIK